MTHPQIEQDDIVDRYVRRQLPPEDQRAFEEHFFGCDDCFGRVQELERFRAGIHDAAGRGQLADPIQVLPVAAGWLRWTFAASVCAALGFAAVAAWLYFGQVRDLREQVGRTSATLNAERAALAQTPPAPVSTERAEGDVAFVMLTASRAANQPDATVLPPGAKRLLLWIDAAPARFREFRLQVASADGRTIATVDHVKRTVYGALLASVPADQLPAGEVRITLTGQDPPPAVLLGDYRLKIEKR